MFVCLFVCFLCVTTVACYVRSENLAIWLLYVYKLAYLLKGYKVEVTNNKLLRSDGQTSRLKDPNE